MAKTALNQLQEQIEAVRREAFAAGFEAAMQAVREFVSDRTSAVGPQSAAPAGRRSARRGRPTGSLQQSGGGSDAGRRRAAGTRPQRGTNARLVEEVLQSNAPRALRPAEIRGAIQNEKGVAIAFTSIRHALGQLETRQIVEQVANTNSWRYRGGGSDSFGESGEPAAASVE